MMDSLDRLEAALADRYTVERELGRGGMATVYLAEDLKHDRRVAVKVLRPDLAASLGPERFLAEIRLTAGLQHPHIVPLFDSGEADGFLYYVMPYIDGESLRSRLEREGRLDVEAVLSIARPVAQALADAHEAGVVHRDVKPENILLSRGQPFVTDFGIARAVSAAGGERLTATGVSIGTPAYMSPEQVLGEGPVDARSDVYSLGCVIYEMLSGSPPFSGSTVQALLARRLAGPPPRLTNVPGPVDDVVRRSLATSPQDRFGTALALADALVEAARRPAVAELSIVVLPFENLSPDPDQEYFSDGLTEEVISDLSKVRSLRVISRSSAMTFKGSGKRIPDIATELKVRYALEGSVRKAGSSLRITAQLIDAEDDVHVWSEKYAGSLEDVFDIQEQVSRSIVDALKVELSPTEEHRIRERSIDDARVLECYMRARHEIWLLSEDSLERGLTLIERGLEIGGENDLLIAQKAWVYLQYVNTMSKPPHTFPALLEEAGRCADRALELNPSSSQALYDKAFILHQRGRPRESIQMHERALRVEPDFPDCLGLLGFQLAAAGRDLERAGGLLDRAEQLDPLTPVYHRGWLKMFEGDFDSAADRFRTWQRILEDSNSPLLLFPVWLHAARGDRGESFRLIDHLVTHLPAQPAAAAGQFMKHALLGDRKKALDAVTEDLRQAARWDDFFSLVMADGYALVEELALAFRWLEHSIDYGYCNTHFLQSEPFLVKLRTDPRFGTLLEKAAKLSDSLLDG